MDDQLETTPRAARAVPASGEAEIAGLEEREKPGKALERELNMSREDVRTLLRENAVLRREKAALLNQWYEAERSLGWKLVQSARNIRVRLFRENTLRGRCWTLFSRFIKTARQSGIRLAVRATLSKIARTVHAADPTEIRLDTGLPGSPGKFQAPGRSVPGFALAVLGRGSAEPIGETRLLQAAPGWAFRRSHRRAALSPPARRGTLEACGRGILDRSHAWRRARGRVRADRPDAGARNADRSRCAQPASARLDRRVVPRILEPGSRHLQHAGRQRISRGIRSTKRLGAVVGARAADFHRVGGWKGGDRTDQGRVSQDHGPSRRRPVGPGVAIRRRSRPHSNRLQRSGRPDCATSRERISAAACCRSWHCRTTRGSCSAVAPSISAKGPICS